MKKNQNNVESDNKINIKDLVKYFQTNQSNLTNNKNNNYNLIDIKLPSITEKIELINNRINNAKESQNKYLENNLRKKRKQVIDGKIENEKEEVKEEKVSIKDEDDENKEKDDEQKEQMIKDIIEEKEEKEEKEEENQEDKDNKIEKKDEKEVKEKDNEEDKDNNEEKEEHKEKEEGNQEDKNNNIEKIDEAKVKERDDEEEDKDSIEEKGNKIEKNDEEIKEKGELIEEDTKKFEEIKDSNKNEIKEEKEELDKIEEKEIKEEEKLEKKEENIIGHEEKKEIEENFKNKFFDINEEEITKKLSDMKTNTILLIENFLKTISTKYQIFSELMIEWYKKQNQQISKILSENSKNLNTAKIKMSEKISIIFKMHENLYSSINDQLTLLDLFLNDNLFDFKFPIEEFIVKNANLMLNGNFLSKIDMKSIYLNKLLDNKDLTEIFQNYYLKRKTNYLDIKNIKLKIKNTKELIETNQKLHGGNENNKEVKFADKINSLTFDHLNLVSFPIERVLFNNIKNLEKLKIKKCINLYNTSLYKCIMNNSKDLKMLKLEGIQLNDKSFAQFFLQITKNNSFVKSLKYLSLRNNNLSSVNFKTKKFIFDNMEMLDFSNNNIYYFSSNNFQLFPKLKILDLTNNNINNNLLFEGIQKSTKHKLITFITLMSQNIFLYNVNENNQKYINYMNENLSILDYNLKRINMTSVYNKNNLEEINKLKFSPSIRISLVKLNLSYCGLNDEAISKFFINNFDLLNLKSLNLNHNFISSKFFTLFSDEKILVDKIQKIDLSFNALKFKQKDDLENLNIFIESHRFLKNLKLQNNKILNVFLKENNNKEYDDEITKLVNIAEKNRLIFEVQMEICTKIDNERFKKVFLYTN